MVSPCPSYKPTCQCAHLPRRDEAVKIQTCPVGKFRARSDEIESTLRRHARAETSCRVTRRGPVFAGIHFFLAGFQLKDADGRRQARP